MQVTREGAFVLVMPLIIFFMLFKSAAAEKLIYNFDLVVQLFTPQLLVIVITYHIMYLPLTGMIVPSPLGASVVPAYKKASGGKSKTLDFKIK